MTTVEKVISQLKKTKLSKEDRIALTTALLDKLVALPASNILHSSNEGLVIAGKKLDMEQMLAFKESVDALKENYARRVIHEQIRYKATEMGIHKATTLEELMFAKAAIWFLNEENILVESLSPTE